MMKTLGALGLMVLSLAVSSVSKAGAAETEIYCRDSHFVPHVGVRIVPQGDQLTFELERRMGGAQNPTVVARSEARLRIQQGNSAVFDLLDDHGNDVGILVTDELNRQGRPKVIFKGASQGLMQCEGNL